MEELMEKLRILSIYNRSDMLSEYGSRAEKEKRFSSREALKIYKKARKKEVLFSKPSLVEALYFLLDEDKKLEYINDIGKFENFSEDYLKGMKNHEVLCRVMRRLVDLGKIDENNLQDTLDYLKKDDPFRFELIKETILFHQKEEGVYFNLGAFFSINDLSDEDKMKLFREVLKNTRHESTIPEMVGAFKCLENRENFHQILKELLTIDVLQISYYSEINTNYVFSNLREEDAVFLANYIIDNRDTFRHTILLEQMLKAYIPAQDIVKIIEKGIKLNFNVLLDKIDEDKWVYLYDYFSSIGAKGKEYLTTKFLAQGIGFLPQEEGDQVLKKALKENEMNISEKYRLLRLSYHGHRDTRRCFKHIEYLLEIEGEKAINDDLYEFIENIEDKYDIDEFPLLKRMVIEKYNLGNKVNCDKYFDRFGTLGIKYIKNKNIIDFINLENKEYDKIMELFKRENREINEDLINTMCNSLLNRQFRIREDDTYSIFGTCERLIQGPKTQTKLIELSKLIEKMSIGIDYMKVMGKRYIDLDKLFEKDKEEMELLHKISNAYIARRREHYVSSNKDYFYKKLNIPKYYEKKYAKKKFFTANHEQFIVNTIKIATKYCKYTKEEMELLDDNETLSKLIQMKKGKLSYSSRLPHMKVLDGIVDKLYEARQIKFVRMPLDVTYTYIMPEPKEEDLLLILKEMKPKHVRDYLLKDETLYNSLNNFLYKYKMPGWGSCFYGASKSADIDTDPSITASLINYYDQIQKNTNLSSSKNVSLTEVLDYACAYATPSRKYEILIGKENLDFIKRDPKPHSSSETKKYRIEKAAQYIGKMYSRKSITIPSGELEIDLSGKRKIRASVGDIYDPIALTYGERTSACLRIGGIFEDLYDYCLTNKNGFHIRFSDPETGEFVSRVSGFRNGNTVFLNELRHSVTNNYCDDDLFEAIKVVAKQIAEGTRNDVHPIDNVIISNACAMEGYHEELLRIDDVCEAFGNMSFSMDRKGHILYLPNEKYRYSLEYNFGERYTSEYRPYNSNVKVAIFDEAKDAVNRVHIINELTKGETMNTIDLLNVDNVEKCVYGHGWVVYVDDKNNIHEFIIDNFKEDKELKKLISSVTNEAFGKIIKDKNIKSKQ